MIFEHARCNSCCPKSINDSAHAASVWFYPNNFHRQTGCVAALRDATCPGMRYRQPWKYAAHCRNVICNCICYEPEWVGKNDQKSWSSFVFSKELKTKCFFYVKLTALENELGNSLELIEINTSPENAYESPAANRFFNNSEIFSSLVCSIAHKSSTSIFSGFCSNFLMHPSMMEISSRGILSNTSICDNKCLISQEN